VLDTPLPRLELQRCALQLLLPPPGITVCVPEQSSPDAEVRRLLAEGRHDHAFERLLAAYRGRVYRLALGFVREPGLDWTPIPGVHLLGLRLDL